MKRTTSEAILNRDESATQDEVLYSSYEEGRRLGARAWKVNEHTPGDPLSVMQVTDWLARVGYPSTEVSRERSSRRRNETGVVADPAERDPTKNQRRITPIKARTVPRPNGSGK